MHKWTRSFKMIMPTFKKIGISNWKTFWKTNDQNLIYSFIKHIIKSCTDLSPWGHQTEESELHSLEVSVYLTQRIWENNLWIRIYAPQSHVYVYVYICIHVCIYVYIYLTKGKSLDKWYYIHLIKWCSHSNKNRRALGLIINDIIK